MKEKKRQDPQTPSKNRPKNVQEREEGFGNKKLEGPDRPST